MRWRAERPRTLAWRSCSARRRVARRDSAVRCIISIASITCTAATRSWRRMCRLAVGMAFASKYREEDRVTLCFFGDGAINQGSFHEALNLAALYKLPVIFICENNLFAMGTSVERSTSLKEIVDRAEGYDIPGLRRGRDELPRGARQTRGADRGDSQGSASGVFRNPHLSLSRPFHVGSGELSHEGAAGEISDGRSDHASACAVAARGRTDDRAVRQNGQGSEGDGAREREVRGGKRGAAARETLRLHLRERREHEANEEAKA